MTVSNYPLSWPQGFPRSKASEWGRFRTSFSDARANVEKELARFAKDSRKVISNVIISSNVTIGGEPPVDAGVAVWFTWDDMQVCIPVDRYSQAAHNLQAISLIIEARRVELRHGTLALVRATFQGFTALPPPRGKHWSEILGIKPSATKADVEAAYRRRARDLHPDAGGDTAEMAELNNARATALQELAA